MPRLTQRQAVVLYDFLQENLQFVAHRADRTEFVRYFQQGNRMMSWQFTLSVLGHLAVFRYFSDNCQMIVDYLPGMTTDQNALRCQIVDKLFDLRNVFLLENQSQ